MNKNSNYNKKTPVKKYNGWSKNYAYTAPARVSPEDKQVLSGRYYSVGEARSIIDLELYRMSQEELTKYIKSVLVRKSIPFSEYDGNIYSIRFEGRPCFFSHMDIIREKSVRKPLYLDKSKGNIHREGGTLGADDRAGVNALLNHIESINFVFTRDEETGCQGATSLLSSKHFMKELEKANCLIEPDRKGSHDIIQYCESDLIEEIERVMPDQKVANGSFTDICKFQYVRPAVNISCGYYNAHSDNEYLNTGEFARMNSLIPKLACITGSFEVSKKPVYKTPTYSGWNYLGDPQMWQPRTTSKDKPLKRVQLTAKGWGLFNDFETCDICGAKRYTVSLGLAFMCGTCASLLVSELIEQ